MSLNNPVLKTFVRRAQSRFIQLDEKCIDNLSLYAMAVYMQLRLLSDFSKECDEIEITIPCIAQKSKMSERKVYDALNELENEHFVIQRLNYHHFRYGKVNSYNVARDYNFFNPNEEVKTKIVHIAPCLHTPAQNDIPVQESYTPAPYAGTPAPYAGTPAQNDIPNNNIISSEVSHKKQNKELFKKNSVFSNSQEVKTHIEKIIANRSLFVEEEIIEQIIYYSYESCKEHGFKEVVKKINIALKLIRDGKWNIPNGYKGVSYKAIKQNEEQLEAQRQQQWKEEAKPAQQIFKAVATGSGYSGFTQFAKEFIKKAN